MAAVMEYLMAGEWDCYVVVEMADCSVVLRADCSARKWDEMLAAPSECVTEVLMAAQSECVRVD